VWHSEHNSAWRIRRRTPPCVAARHQPPPQRICIRKVAVASGAARHRTAACGARRTMPNYAQNAALYRTTPHYVNKEGGPKNGTVFES